MALRPTRRLATALLLATLVAAGCSDDDGDASPPSVDEAATEATTTTAAPEPLAWGDLAERGPFGVGSTTLDLGGRRVAVWYPADPGTGQGSARDSFDIASLLSPELQAQIPAELRVGYPVAATAGAAAATDDGPFPVVLFSHGFAGFPEQSVDLTTHLASWGFVVAAPDHVERSLSGLLGTAAQGVTPSSDAEVLTATLDLVLAEADAGGAPPLAGLVDPDRVAVVGHSAGAGAAYAVAAADDRIDAFAALSLGRGRGDSIGAAPTVPGLVMLGEADGIIPPATTREVFATLATPRLLLALPGAGHLVFSDLCRIGAEQGGLTGIVATIGLDIPADLLRLASDGCGDAYPPVDEAFPAIDATTLAFLRATFDPDDPAAALLVSGPVDAGPAEALLTVER
jgi:predicted dienelactone hydrolase